MLGTVGAKVERPPRAILGRLQASELGPFVAR